MSKDGKTIPGGVPAKSGCGCSAKPAAAGAAEMATGCCGGGHNHADRAHHEHHAAAKTGVRDPVCGMTVDPETARAKGLHSAHKANDQFFCGRGCKLDFDEDPGRYLDPTYTPSM